MNAILLEFFKASLLVAMKELQDYLSGDMTEEEAKILLDLRWKAQGKNFEDAYNSRVRGD